MNQKKKELNQKKKELNQKRKEINQEEEEPSPVQISKDQEKEEEDEGIMMESEEYHDHSYRGPVSKLPSGFIDSNLRMAHMERRRGSKSDSDDHDEDVDNMFYKRRSSMSFDPTSKRVLFPPTSYSFFQQGSPQTQRGSSNQVTPGGLAHSGQRSSRRQSRQSLPSVQLAPSLLALPPWNESHHAEGKKKHRKRSPNLVSPVSDNEEITPVIEKEDNLLFTSRHQRRASSMGRLTWRDNQNGGGGYLEAPPSYNQQNNAEPEDEPFGFRSPRHPRPRRGSFRKEEESSSCVIT